MCAVAHGWVYDWQTLITGGLALLAGVVTVVGTVWGTLSAANRQVRAVKAAADRQITAAQEQTAAAQHQTAVMRDMERRRIASEGCAFHAMLEAAMSAIIEDVAAVQTSAPARSAQAYAARQAAFKQATFAELRVAFIRFGGALTAQFLRLDKEIENFLAEWERIGFLMNPMGVNAEQLGRIKQHAIELRDEAAAGMKRCRDELAQGIGVTGPAPHELL
jgi:hypothetical protein